MSEEKKTIREAPQAETGEIPEPPAMREIPEEQLMALLDNWDKAKAQATEYYSDLMTLISALKQIGFSIGAGEKGKGGKGSGLGSIMSTLARPGAFKALTGAVEKKIAPIIEKYERDR